MRPKSLVLLGLALFCGLVASVGISQVLDGKNQATVATVPIYVALQNINLGDPLDEGMVSLQEWPKDKVPVGAITKWEEIEERRPRTVIFEGEPLLDGKFLPKGQTHDPIAGIPSGMRLKTISVDAQKSVAGLLSPGDRVDLQLYVKKNERESIADSFTKIIMQNVRVYAVDQTIQRSADGAEARTVAKTVSLIVTPQQANRITTAENLGDISLIPRHPDDEKIVDDWEQSIDDLLARSDSNSREFEQGERTSQPEGGLAAGLANALQQSMAVETTPPFKMKVIFPDEVQELQFDAETGEPLDAEGQDDFGTAGAVDSMSSDDEETDLEDDEFPIELKK
ncbi:MAG: Flp pilus assembly protein CpaB [Planctomycetes bacterium]|nr:Flp pilus assembly protein CpaB [Planctomycetota bacterium]